MSLFDDHPALPLDESLSLPETEALATCESVIAAGLATFVEVGRALSRIRDERLYRASHRSFEAYVRERWAMAGRSANRLIEGATIAQHVGPIGPTSPTAEAQVRPLAGLPAPAQRIAWEEAVATAPDGRPTGRHVAETVERLARPEPEEEPDEAPQEAPDEPQAEEAPAPPSAPAPVTTRHAALFTSDSDEWGTPPDLYALLDAEFHFDLDGAAAPHNTKHPDFYSADEDGLAQSWAGRRVWLNPPYSRVGPFVAKAHEEAAAGALVVLLIPARTDTGWWWRHCWDGEVRFLRGRIRFLLPDGTPAPSGAPFPSAVVVFRPGLPPDEEHHGPWHAWPPSDAASGDADGLSV